ncbi:MAG: YhjD/YihY/BrkB family envelope integrity protein [Kiritimatiellae bacterium]|nr:YhjD/YihY/BrkB family envelope integrity protein [Kiritimatiellia bacterium]MDD5523327.1 YhjD/YihY/BrkB family envelope integrity protein [Kiritimatiellia bacterium]
MKQENFVSWEKRWKKRVRALFDYIWDAELSSVSWLHRFGVQVLRVMHIVAHGFKEDECALRSSALTFSTLMAIVPVLVLSLALAREVGNVEVAREKLHDVVIEWASGSKNMALSQAGSTIAPAKQESAEHKNPDRGIDESVGVVPQIAEAINGMVDRMFKKVENMKFKTLGGVGLVILVLMVIDVLSCVEAAFNRVWAVTSSRTILRKFTDYLSVVMILPVLIIAASSLPIVAFATKFLDETVAANLRFWVGSAMLKNLTMVVMTTLGFTFLIVFMPNTKVKTGPGLTGGFVTAMLFLCWLWICAALQLGVANYGKIYGSFAVIPIVLAWIYVSWCIVLFGAEVAFAIQNCSTYRMEQGRRHANMHAKVMLALSIVLEAARALTGKGDGFSISGYSAKKRIPIRFMNEVVDELVQVGLLAELSEKSGRFVLLKTPETVKVKDVVEVMMGTGVEPENLGLAAIDPVVERLAKKALNGINSSLSDTSVQDLMKE